MNGDPVIEALVAVVRRTVEAGHYSDGTSGIMACDAKWDRGPCDCGWEEARAALDAWDARSS